MAVRTLNELKAWFLTGKKPTQQQYHDWMDSYVHRNDGIAIENVAQLPQTLLAKADAIQLQNYLLKREGWLFVDSVEQLGTISNENCQFVLVNGFAVLIPLQTTDLANDDTTFYSSKDGWLWQVVLQPFNSGNGGTGMLADRFTIDGNYQYNLPIGSFADMICIKPTGDQTITISYAGEGEILNEELLAGGVWKRISIDLVADEAPFPIFISGVTDDCSVIVYKRLINDL